MVNEPGIIILLIVSINNVLILDYTNLVAETDDVAKSMSCSSNKSRISKFIAFYMS